MEKCELCPRKCQVDRTNSLGFCGADEKIKIAKYSLFEFEEPCISGKGGSGAIFFSHCSLKCVFCQNYEISALGKGKEISISELADIFKELETIGADNINLVNPTHYVEQIIEAIKIYRPNIPIIYNTHGYENLKTLQKIEPYIDVYLPDFKYESSTLSFRYSKAKDYSEKTKQALLFMRNSKRDVFVNGMIKHGVIVRHLILPLCTNDSISVLEWVKQNMPHTKVSLMAQYTPYAKACEYKEINRKITKREYDKVLNKFLELGLDGYVQDLSSASEKYIPLWKY